MTEPSIVERGTLVVWERTEPVYPPSGGYTLRYEFTAFEASFSAAGVQSGPDSWEVTLDGTFTSTLFDGSYLWRAYVELGATTILVGSGRTTVRAQGGAVSASAATEQADEAFDDAYRGLAPDDPADPPRFGQPAETTKDAFVLGLRQFFASDQIAGRLVENPTVEKYATNLASGLDPFLTTVNVVQEHPDLLERLPHISVTISGGRNRRLSVGTPLIAQVQTPPRVEGTVSTPVDLSGATGVVPAEYVLRYRTQPARRGVWVESRVIFRANRFSDWTQASVTDIVRVINEQALYVRAFVTNEGTIGLECGGIEGGQVRPNTIEILDTSTAGLLDLLGLRAGRPDTSFNTARPAANRYHHATEFQVNVDVISADVNTRRELADQVYSWATFWKERDFFELQGRTWENEDVNTPQEWWHIIFHQEVAMGQYQATDRLQSGKDQVHLQRITIPVTTMQYLDRPVRFETGGNWVAQETTVARDSTLPARS